VKLKDYQSRVADLVEHYKGMAFEWGHTDCVALTLKAMTAMTGDEAHEKLISWHSKLEAAAVFHKDINPVEYLNQIGAEKINVYQGATGDILTGVETKLKLPATGVIVGVHVMSSSIEHGVYISPLDFQVIEESEREVWRLI
tara:strand:- start:741 stop:1166 length:426 start_codon:yes stop_codon:yes gene_type:complete